MPSDEKVAHVNGVTKPTKRSARRYRPLDVSSWWEAWRVVLGWILVPCFAIVTTALLYMYEMKYITVGDRDLRDMYLDHRLMNGANNMNHKFFVNADVCCNLDPIVFGERSEGCIPSNYADSDWVKVSPLCPPIIMIECPGSIEGTECNTARAAVYPEVGLDPITGAITDCRKAGRVRVGVQWVPGGRPLVVLGTFNDTLVGQVAVSNPVNIDVLPIRELIQTLINLYPGSDDYIHPNVRLSKAFKLSGQPIPLRRPHDDSYGEELFFWPISGGGGMKTIKPWPFPIFNWPGAFSGRCPNTTTREQWYLNGTVTIPVPPYNFSDPASMITTLDFYQDSLQISPWKLEAAEPDPDAAVPHNVSLQVMTKIKVYVGMIYEAGACWAWMIDDSQWGTTATYEQVWKGSMKELVVNGLSNITSQEIQVLVYDTASPERPKLPFYGGMWYIVFCFAMGAVWTFSFGFFLFFGLPLIWWNVRSNTGYPPVVYKYMKKYRGW